MKGGGAESGVQAETIVFLHYSKDFHIGGKAVSSAWRGQTPKKPELPRQPRKGEPSTVAGRGPPRGFARPALHLSRRRYLAQQRFRE